MPMNGFYILLNRLPRPLFWITLTYLIFELSFSAMLLDIAGGNSTQDDIEGIEKYGRALSGIALGLVIVPLISGRKHWSIFKKAISIILLFPISITFMYQLQDKIVESMIEGLNGLQRKEAAVLALAAPLIATGDLEIVGQKYTEDNHLASAEAKSFVALFPALALYKDDLNKDINILGPSLVRASFTQSCEVGKDGCLGNSEEFRTHIWKEIYQNIEKNYHEIKTNYQKQMSRENIIQQQNESWKSYLDYYKERTGSHPKYASRYMYKRLRNDVQEMYGIKLPKGWNPNDRYTFINAIHNKIQQDASSALRSHFGTTQNISFGLYFKQTAVQDNIRKTLKIENINIVFKDVVTPAEVEKYIYTPIVKELVDIKLNELNSNEKEFNEGGEYQSLGEKSAKRVIVPAIALIFSLLGGLTHFVKSGVLFLEISRLDLIQRLIIMVSISFAILLLPFKCSNSVIESSPYQILHNTVKEKRGILTAKTIEWIIRAESEIYPFNTWIRINVLGGFNFSHEILK